MKDQRVTAIKLAENHLSKVKKNPRNGSSRPDFNVRSAYEGAQPDIRRMMAPRLGPNGNLF